MLTVRVNMADKAVRKTLENAAAALDPARAATACADAGADTVRAHFRDLAASRHRPGQRLNFWLAAAEAVTRETDGGDALIRVPQAGVAQRFYGGDILPSGRTSPVTGRPVRRLALGIPGTPGEGHIPADFPDLFLILKKGSRKGGDKGGAFLARKRGDGVQRLFTLLARVRQRPDPAVLPTEDELSAAAAEAILELHDKAVPSSASGGVHAATPGGRP